MIQKKISRHFYLLPEAIITLFIGGFIYILFRSDSLVMFGWFEKLRISAIIYHLRDTHILIYLGSYKTLINILPGGLWTFSYTVFLLYIWNLEINSKNIFYYVFIPASAILSEILQLTELIPGTFNYIDIISYIAGTILPLFIHIRTLKTKFYEKF